MSYIINKNLIYLILSISFFFGCSSKQYYEPQDTKGGNFEYKDINSTIISITSDGATLEDGGYISSKGIQTRSKAGFEFINQQNDTVILANLNGEVIVSTKENSKLFKFKNDVISASIKNNLLALLFVDNSIALYNMENRKILFKEYFKPSVVNNTKIANPIFLNKIILYPTLNGKIVIANIKNKNITKRLNIDPRNDINNIIYLKQVNDDTLIVATSNRIFTFVDGKVAKDDLFIKDIAYKNRYIYVASLDGRVIKYDINLNKIKKIKFKFANIYAIVASKNIYALESQGYLIKMNKNLEDIVVYDFSFDEKQKVISIGDTLYYEDQYIKLD